MVTRDSQFVEYQPLLFAIAYRMVGTVADAEDLVQETYLRWQRAQEHQDEPITSPKSWLTTTLTNLCIDHLRSARVRREEYIGPWLPEPLITAQMVDPAEQAMLADSLSLAFLTVLERLNPIERAVFLLHDVFGYEFTEIAPIVAKSASNCRQLARRAREHVLAKRPRFAPAPRVRERLTDEFLRACTAGDLPSLIATLSDDIAIWSDGGGKALAARKSVQGVEKAAAFMLYLAQAGVVEQLVYQQMEINGQPGVIAFKDGHPYSVLALDIVDDRIHEIAIIVNPDKLQHLVLSS